MLTVHLEEPERGRLWGGARALAEVPEVRRLGPEALELDPESQPAVPLAARSPAGQGGGAIPTAITE